MDSVWLTGGRKRSWSPFVWRSLLGNQPSESAASTLLSKGVSLSFSCSKAVLLYSYAWHLKSPMPKGVSWLLLSSLWISSMAFLIDARQVWVHRIRFFQTKSELLANSQFSFLSFNDNVILLSCRNGENLSWMMSNELLLQSNIQLSENFYYPFGLIHSSCADSFFWLLSGNLPH